MCDRLARTPALGAVAVTSLRRRLAHAPTISATAVASLPQQLARVTRTPAFGVAMIAPLMFAGAVGATAPHFPGAAPAVRGAAITPVAAVAPAHGDLSRPTVIAVAHPPSRLRIAAGTLSAPPPAFVVNTPGVLGIPKIALSAYRNAEQIMAASAPGCGVSWNLLAGIGRIESMHASGGATDAHGTAVRPIYGPSLDGTLPGNAIIVQSSVAGRVTYARAMGPMQFLPGTWAHFASDGDGDGVADPQNLYDSTLAAARYLCSGGLNLRDASQVMTAILRYNNSMPYAQNVLGWAAAYATGVVPVDLPPLVGAPPPIADIHLENNPEGLGPGLPTNIHGLPSMDALAQMPLIDLSGQPTASAQQPMWPWQSPTTRAPSCTVICLGQDSTPQQAAGIPPWLAPPPADAMSPGTPAAPPAGPQPGPPAGAPAVGPQPGSQPARPGPGPQQPGPATPPAAVQHQDAAASGSSTGSQPGPGPVPSTASLPGPPPVGAAGN
jgi:membrane-bound lytic murein transglycosylase B